jgi:hypothetical protein
VADDYTGFKTAFSAFVTALLTDQGINYPNEETAQANKQWVALLRQKMTAQGITL